MRRDRALEGEAWRNKAVKRTTGVSLDGTEVT